jgi:hypothetical protein
VLTTGAALLALIAAIHAWRSSRELDAGTVLNNAKSGQAAISEVDWHGPPLDARYARLFVPLDDSIAVVARGGVADRYRLVGVMLQAGVPARSVAFIEEKAKGRQRRLRVGEALEPSVTVKSIASTEVWVSGPAGEECLRRDGQRAMDPAGSPVGVEVGGSGGVSEGLERFGGARTGTNSWRFSRGAILEYYQELLDRPERLVKVFDSLAPVYDASRGIEGYRVTIEGEADFFEAVGLREGDIVRSVNSIEMTNRRRAENLIRRFTQNDLDLVIIELDRGGQRLKQIYDTAK